MIDAFCKYYNIDISGVDKLVKFINIKINNFDKYLFETTPRIDWKRIAVSGSYSLNSMFEKDRNLVIIPINVGLSLY